MDLEGPFTTKTPHTVLALTLIDPTTRWSEIFKATNEPAASIQDLFHNTCLVQYPHPHFIVFDNGGKFKHEFKQKRENYGIIAKLITSRNLQANLTHDQIHKAVIEIIKSIVLEKENSEEEKNLIISSSLLHGL